MAHVLITHEVEDYSKWKAVFDQHNDAREEYGSQGGTILRNDNKVSILSNTDDLNRFLEMFESETLKTAMQQAGVIGKPEIQTFTETETFSI